MRTDMKDRAIRKIVERSVRKTLNESILDSEDSGLIPNRKAAEIYSKFLSEKEFELRNALRKLMVDGVDDGVGEKLKDVTAAYMWAKKQADKAVDMRSTTRNNMNIDWKWKHKQS